MANNSWGYAFGAETTTDSSLTYQSFTGSSQTLNSSNPSVSNYAVDFTRKLVFAAKFNQDAANGHYRANVKLNLTITPKVIVNTWSTGVDSGITTMQEMTSSICKQVTTPTNTNIPTLTL